MKKHWEFWIDRGGTFTDVIAKSEDGNLCVEKLLSDNPNAYHDAALEGIVRILKAHNNTVANIKSVKMGTTVATNALLQKKGAACALIITQGFKDLLTIAYQNRAELFALEVKKPLPLYRHVIEANERLDAKGKIIKALDEELIYKQLTALKEKGIDALAIALMHSLNNPAHELKIAQIASELGFNYIYCSHQVSSVAKLVRRGHTAVIDAYLSPILRHYIDTVLTPLKECKLLFMQSSGGLTNSQHFLGKNSILSGPAGGVVGAVKAASKVGLKKIIGFDMGGTSTDVSHYQGHYERLYECQIEGYLLDVPMMNIHTVAAGGGSVLKYIDKRMVVGPESAGAYPGPACYRNGGPLTITDATLVLGKIPIDSFPKIFANGKSLDSNTSHDLFAKLASTISEDLSAEQVAQGFIDVAVDNMSNAIKKISSDKGHEVSNYTLLSFGGAGAQHACLIAEKLGMQQVWIPRLASVLSAMGIGMAEVRHIESEHIAKPLTELHQEERSQLKERLLTKLGISNHQQVTIEFKTTFFLNYRGSDQLIELDYQGESVEALKNNFHQAHKQAYGFYELESDINIETISIEAILNEKSHFIVNSKHQEKPPRPHKFYSNEQWHNALRYDLLNCYEEQEIVGPAIIVAENTTIVIEPGWIATVDAAYNVKIKQQQKKAFIQQELSTASPVLLEIFNNAFMNIAELMGSVLAQTAHSVNIKERRDYSCALFDCTGNLIANAPHMPVHLGSMSDSVKQIQQKCKVQEGESYLLNNPYKGGTHLPDITVVTPFFYQANLQFFVASRGHHADIGGISPGSLPANSTSIEQEGIIIDDFLLVENNKLNHQPLLALLNSGGARNPQQNLADIKAQLAANVKGIKELNALLHHYGSDTVNAYVDFIQKNAELCVENALSLLHSGSTNYLMDGGMKICTSVTIQKKKATIDFSGTSSQQKNNFNAPVSVCKAAVLYVLRTLVQHEIPLNEGCLKPIKLILPKASLINPEYPSAVVAGNVETSQAIVNSLYCSLGTMAAAQGSMNNLTFGNAQYQYYETLCGGTGAGETFDGCDAIHSHMTNSLLTDPEVLEARFPVLLQEFSIRKNSGGNGKHCGGNGVKRVIKFLQEMTVNMISNHRETAPPGIFGGASGKPGENKLIKANGQQQSLGACFEIQVAPGDVLQIKTPGGGGYGKI